MSIATKWRSKVIYLLVALAMTLGMLMIPAVASADISALTVVPVDTPPAWVHGDAKVTITATDPAGGLDNVDLHIEGPTLPNAPQMSYTLNIDIDENVIDDDLARQLGIDPDVDVAYSGDNYSGTWTIIIDTTRKVHIGDSDLLFDDWQVGQEVWFDGNYTFEAQDNTGGSTGKIGAFFDNEEQITPNLGLDAKSSEQIFWVNYIDAYEGELIDKHEPPLCWYWDFVPGVNLDTVGTIGSGADVIVTDGGKPGIGELPPNPTTSVPPDRFATIWSRAPELGECVIEVYLDECDEVGELESMEVAAAEKRWGELYHSVLDVDGDTPEVEHEVEEDAGIWEELAESVESTFINLPDPQPAGGALVHWWLVKDSEANQEWIRDLMADIADRAGDEGYVDEWMATGKYDPIEPTYDQIVAWITDAADPKMATETEWGSLNPEGDPTIQSDRVTSWYGWNTPMDYLPGQQPGMAYAALQNYGIEDVLVVTMVEYQEDYNAENLILIQIGKKHFAVPPPVPPSPPGVPTVDHWGIVAMITLFAGLLIWTVRRRQLAG